MEQKPTANTSVEELKAMTDRLARFNLPERLWSYQYILLQLASIMKETTQGIEGGNFSYTYVSEKANKLLREAKGIKGAN